MMSLTLAVLFPKVVVPPCIYFWYKLEACHLLFECGTSLRWLIGMKVVWNWAYGDFYLITGLVV